VEHKAQSRQSPIVPILILALPHSFAPKISQQQRVAEILQASLRSSTLDPTRTGRTLSLRIGSQDSASLLHILIFFPVKKEGSLMYIVITGFEFCGDVKRCQSFKQCLLLLLQ
jgi:hypothetical protein